MFKGRKIVISEKFYVGYSDIDKNFKLSNVALLKAFQNIVTMHATKANDSLKSTNYGWFLTSYKVKVLKRPEYESWYNLSTWSRSVKGVTASREFESKDEKGNLQLCALSNWVRINKTTQKIERVAPEIIEAYGQEEKTNFESPWTQKLQECGKVDYEKNITIERNFIDFHHHVNNVSYLELAYIALPDDVYNSFECNEFEIMYKQAIKCHDEVCLQYTEEEKYYNITIKSKDKTTLHAIIHLYK